jgi:hypothetical protein
MGLVVRLQGTNNPDKNWVQPDILMWGYVFLSHAETRVTTPEMYSNPPLTPPACSR